MTAIFKLWYLITFAFRIGNNCSMYCKIALCFLSIRFLYLCNFVVPMSFWIFFYNFVVGIMIRCWIYPLKHSVTRFQILIITFNILHTLCMKMHSCVSKVWTFCFSLKTTFFTVEHQQKNQHHFKFFLLIHCKRVVQYL